jgi:hypothetical protein
VRSLVLHIFTWIILTAFGLLATGIGLKPSSYLGGMAIGPSPTLVMKDRSVPTIREARNELGSEEYRLIRQYANEYSIDYRLILAIIKQESQFDAEALSGRGATGLMQLMPVTNEEVTENLQMEEFDLVHSNIRGGIYYFAKLMKLFQQSNTDDQHRNLLHISEMIRIAGHQYRMYYHSYLNDIPLFIGRSGKMPNRAAASLGVGVRPSTTSIAL